jgi:Tfp pilus assembly protein PilV
MTTSIRRPPLRARSRRPARGFTLVGVLVAAVVAAFGILSLVKVFGTMAASGTQNQNISQAAALGNGFWGVVQANPSIVTDSHFVTGGTPFSDANNNLSSAPAALQPWLRQTTAFLPTASVAIATSNDAGFGTSCAASTGCTVTMTVSWTQAASVGIGGSTRSQTFYYQFGL